MSKDDEIPEVDRVEGAPHPRHTTGLYGQEQAEQTFLDAFRGGRFPHAWILGGPEGVGKATFAYRAARFLFAHPDPMAAGVRDAQGMAVAADHPASRRVAARAHGGLFVLRRAWNAERKVFRQDIRVDDARSAVGFFESTAAEGGWRVCIVDSAEDLNANSANALLKMVEEPPQRSLFLIVSHVPGRILPTIRSRCRMLRFRPLPAGDVRRALEAGGAGEGDAGLVARAAGLSGGSVKKAYEILDEGTLAIVEHIRGALERLPAIDWADLHQVADGLAGRTNDAAFATVVETIFDWLGEQTRARAGEGARRLAPLAEVWDKVARQVRETDAYNLDRRALVLTLFTDLSDALRASRAA